MWTTAAIDPCFLDRRGCGDEIYLDAAFKAAQWLDEIKGAELLATVAGDEEQDDDSSEH